MKIYDHFRFGVFLVFFCFWLIIFIIGVVNINPEKQYLIYSKEESTTGVFEYKTSVFQNKTYQIEISQRCYADNENDSLKSNLIVLIESVILINDTWERFSECDSEGCNNIADTFFYQIKANLTRSMIILLNFSQGDVSTIKIYENLPSNISEIKNYYTIFFIMGLFSMIFLFYPLIEAGENPLIVSTYEKTKNENLYVIMLFIFSIFFLILGYNIPFSPKTIQLSYYILFYAIGYFIFWILRLIYEKHDLSIMGYESPPKSKKDRDTPPKSNDFQVKIL